MVALPPENDRCLLELELELFDAVEYGAVLPVVAASLLDDKAKAALRAMDKICDLLIKLRDESPLG